MWKATIKGLLAHKLRLALTGLAIVLGFFVLFHFVLGTALGIYTLWVLLPAQSQIEYQRTARVV